MRWCLIYLISNLAATAYSLPEDTNIFADQAGSASVPFLDNENNGAGGVDSTKELDFSEKIAQNNDAASDDANWPDDNIFLDSVPSEFDSPKALTFGLSGCLSPISRIRARAEGCLAVGENLSQVGGNLPAIQDVTVDGALTGADTANADEAATVKQEAPIFQDLTLAQSLPANPGVPVDAGVPVVQGAPVAQDVPVVEDAPVVQGVEVAQNVPVLQNVAINSAGSLLSDLTGDEALSLFQIRKYWCSDTIIAGFQNIPVCNIDADSFNGEQPCF